MIKRDDYDFRNSALNFFNFQAEYSVIENCCVNQRGLIYKNGTVIFNTALEHAMWIDKNFNIEYIAKDKRFNSEERGNLIFERLQGYNSSFQKTLEKARYVDHDETTLHLMHPFWNYEYGHFFDTFQKTLKAPTDLNIKSFLASQHGKVKEFDMHLKVLGLDTLQMLSISNENEIHRFKKLIYVYPVSDLVNFTNDSLLRIRKKYFDYFKISIQAEPKLKLFLTREPPLKRVITNYENLKQSLLRANIIIVDGSESLREIIQLFSQASHVAGVHGSLFANLIFANPNAKFIEFCPVNRPDFTFLNKCRSFSHYEHYLVGCDANFDIKLDQQKLLSFYSN